MYNGGWKNNGIFLKYYQSEFMKHIQKNNNKIACITFECVIIFSQVSKIL